MNLKKILMRFFYYQKVLIYRFDVKDYEKEYKSNIPLFIEHASFEDIKEIYENKEMDLKEVPWDYLTDKFKKSIWKIIVAKIDKKCVAYASYSETEMSFVGTKRIEMMLPQHSIYIFKDFVIPEYRNKLIGKHLGDYRIKALKEEGTTIGFAAVNSTNQVQIHNFGKLGGYYIGFVTFIKCKFFNEVFISKSIVKSGLKIQKIIENYDYSLI